jgi:plastocyanin
MIKHSGTFALLCALISCLFIAVPSLSEEAATVSIDNFSFAPAELKVKAGTKVKFVNHDDIPHSVVGETIKFHSKALDTDDSFAFSFDKPGEIVYFCGLHPQMKGKIVVTP